uniref:N-lysine methyltransferase setd6 n=1 Tax=Erigeron canadensis TaxID=72917 RepID=UPI001CB9BB61|nr:N-lysine methyltransferase setd6 [Erigeron canadensis]XP_043629195.1 N-lysine methyltransferase setd6 [Erigeron canadensis]
MSSTSSSRRMRAFKRWMKENSIQHTQSLNFTIQKEIDIQKEEYISVYTSSDLHEGDVIATIPKKTCLTVKTSGACQLIQDFCLEGYMALSVAVMFEISMAHKSPWFPYLQMLPPHGNLDVPLLWSLEEIDEMLVGTELYKTIKEDKALVYDDWKACIVPFVESAPVKLNPDDFGLDKYFSAKSLISSRSFQIDDYYGFGLVPLADLFNHKTNAEDVHFTSVSLQSESDTDTSENMENEVDDDLDGDLSIQNGSNIASPKCDDDDTSESSSSTDILEMIMVKDVKAGAEVFNTYGSMGNAALLHRYGFTEPDNPYDIVNIDLELVLEWSSSIFSSRHSRRRLFSWKRLYHSEFPNQDIDYFEVSTNGEPELELLKLIFIISLPEKAYDEFDKSKIATISNKNRIILGEITETNKKLLLTESVQGALLSLADIRDRCYGLRSLEDDVQALKTCPATNKKLYHSLMLRVSERKILEKLRIYASVSGRLLNACNGSTTKKKLTKR